MENDNATLDNKFNEIVAKTLKKYRERSGMSLEDVAKKMKIPITRQSLFKYENNLARIKNNIFIDICNAIGVDPRKVYEEINFNSIKEGRYISENTNETTMVPIRDLRTGDISYGYVTNDKTSAKKIDETDVLFDKYKDVLTESDKEIIKTIIEQRKKEIDKQLGED